MKARLHLKQLTVTQKDLKANQADEQQKIGTDSIVPYGERKKIQYHKSNKLLKLVGFVFPIEVPGELDPLSLHKLCVYLRDYACE